MVTIQLSCRDSVVQNDGQHMRGQLAKARGRQGRSAAAHLHICLPFMALSTKRKAPGPQSGRRVAHEDFQSIRNFPYEEFCPLHARIPQGSRRWRALAKSYTIRSLRAFDSASSTVEP